MGVGQVSRSDDTSREGFRLRPISHGILRLFIGYISFYLRRHFQGLQLLNSGNARNLDGWPILVCMNHPSWWDPLLALYLSQYFFPQREHYGPIATVGLSQYQFFEKLGFFGIDPKTRAGAAQFLQTGRAVLAREDAALWVTAQGHFTDVRVRPMQLQGGVAHLAHTTNRFVMLPIALEYSFWNERKPQAFAGVGDPVFIEDGTQRSTAEWLAVFSKALEDTQTTLAEHVERREVEAFQPVFKSASGVGGLYDLWRALKYLTGRRSLRTESKVRST